MAELLLKEEVYAIIGAAMEVYYQLGAGFLEAVYQEAFELEMGQRNISFEPQKRLAMHYKGTLLRREYIADAVCFGQIIVELKALDRLSGIEESQLIKYLKVTKYQVGLLINFGSRPRLEWKRYVL